MIVKKCLDLYQKSVRIIKKLCFFSKKWQDTHQNGGNMNYSYALYVFATHLFTCARMYDREYCLLEMCRRDDDIDDNIIASTVVDCDFIRNNKASIPLIFSVNEDLVYAWIDSGKHYFLLGPTRFYSHSPNSGIAPILLKNNLSFSDIDVSKLAEITPECTIQILADDTTILYNLEREEKRAFLDSQTLIKEMCYPPDEIEDTMETLYQTMFDQVENSFAHNPYNHEKLEVSYVKNGDVDSLRMLLQERFPGRYGRLSDDPIKQEIYLAIVAVTLASRAAIEGGLHPEAAFYLSDVSIHKIGTCRDANEIIRLTVDTELQYAALVRDLKNATDDDVIPEENPHISRCKDYIFAHMHGKITVKELANAVGLETNYLSTLFKKCEKKTLKQYITEEKVKLIKNLLTYSSYSYIEIATYLGFSSQSHMGMEFKRITGMTPGEYRAKFIREDFMNDSMFVNEE